MRPNRSEITSKLKANVSKNKAKKIDQWSRVLPDQLDPLFLWNFSVILRENLSESEMDLFHEHLLEIFNVLSPDHYTPRETQLAQYSQTGLRLSSPELVSENLARDKCSLIEVDDFLYMLIFLTSFNVEDRDRSRIASATAKLVNSIDSKNHVDIEFLKIVANTIKP